MEKAGLIYVMYFDDKLPVNKSPVKIHNVTGTVNGYFDRTLHGKYDWSRLLTTATYSYFDLIGLYTHITFRTDVFRNNTDNGFALINWFDEKLTHLEWEFLGYIKHNRLPPNRLYIKSVLTGGYMSTSQHRIVVSNDVSRKLAHLSKLTNGSNEWCWGIAHEMGQKINFVRILNGLGWEK